MLYSNGRKKKGKRLKTECKISDGEESHWPAGK